jgi:hypothetical protein
MPITYKLNIENKAIFTTSVFYAVAGILFLAWTVLANYPPHTAIMGMFSLIAAYGILRKRTWALWPILTLLFVATTFSAYMIYYAAATDLILGLSMVAYLILTWIFTIYVAARRNILT